MHSTDHIAIIHRKVKLFEIAIQVIRFKDVIIVQLLKAASAVLKVYSLKDE